MHHWLWGWIHMVSSGE